MVTLLIGYARVFHRRARPHHPKAKGRLRGKQPKLNPRQEAHLAGLYRTGEHTTGELADLFSVGRSTVYRAIERDDRRVHG